MKLEVELKYLSIKKEVEAYKAEITIKYPCAFFSDGVIVDKNITKDEQEYFEKILNQRDMLYRELQKLNSNNIS